LEEHPSRRVVALVAKPRERRVTSADRRRDDVRNDPVPVQTVCEDDDSNPLSRVANHVAVKAATVVSPVPHRQAVLSFLESPAQTPTDLWRELSGGRLRNAVLATLIDVDLRAKHLRPRFFLEPRAIERGDQEARIVEGGGLEARRGDCRSGTA